MRVQVKLFSLLRKHLPEEAKGEATIELPEGATVDDLVEQLGIVRRIKILTINGERETDRYRLLQEGDSVRIFPFVVGG
jgi:sulfur carrier protein ThiS